MDHICLSKNPTRDNVKLSRINLIPNKTLSIQKTSLQWNPNLSFHNDHFPACTIHHFWSRMKFHINNVIYSRIHCSPNYCFTALIICTSRSRSSISRMDRLKKKLKRRSIYYMCYLLFGLQIWQHSNAVTLRTWPSAPRPRY